MQNYLEPGRIEDVVRFIQVTALRPDFSQNDKATHDDSGKPRSASRWIDLAENHPEFFRVAGESPDREKRSISSLARFYYQLEGERRPPLPWAYAEKLIDTAASLQERQIRNQERAKTALSVFGVIVAALIAGLFAIATKK